MLRRFRVLTAFAICTSVLGCGGGGGGGADTPPVTLTYFGVNLDWDVDSPAALNARLGHKAAVYVRFFTFPLSPADAGVLTTTLASIAAESGRAMITLEPLAGLDTVTLASADEFALTLASANPLNVPILVRFGQEMNGSWYAWGQDPAAYVQAFRLLADAVHSQAPGVEMVWAPNYGGGYPFSGGPYEATPDQPRFALLDTDGDGVLSMGDDPYLPYYPGDDAVDWVGMSLYHWGSVWPWGENEIPEPGKFIAQLTGTYSGLGGDDSAIPDFYQVYSVQHGKPVAITETAALYNTEVGGDDELSIKQAWWRQVFDRDTLIAHPGIRMINWFEHIKPESEIGNAVVDWRVLGSTGIADPFKAGLPVDLLTFADQQP